MPEEITPRTPSSDDEAASGPGSELSVPLGTLAAEILASPARMGRVRLVTVDGYSGSGKTSLAKRLAWAMHRVPVVHLDHLYDGWDGLDGVGCSLDSWVVTPLRNHLPGRHLVYDWSRGGYAEWREVPLAPALVVEGSGAGQRRFATVTTLSIWVDCDVDLRRERAINREGADSLANLESWWLAEEQHFGKEQTRERADLVIDGSLDMGTSLSSSLTLVEDRRRGSTGIAAGTEADPAGNGTPRAHHGVGG